MQACLYRVQHQLCQDFFNPSTICAAPRRIALPHLVDEGNRVLEQGDLLLERFEQALRAVTLAGSDFTAARVSAIAWSMIPRFLSSVAAVVGSSACELACAICSMCEIAVSICFCA